MDQAERDAVLYRDEGVDGLLIENMHDRPYLRSGDVGPEVVACMTRIARTVREAAGGLPCGVQVLAGANREALSIALAAGLEFVRVEGYVFAHIADEGWIDGCAGELLRYRRAIGAEGVQIYTDIKKKHSAHAITADVSLAETARAAAFSLSDGIIISGPHTGAKTDVRDLSAVKAACELPVLIGSGVTAENCREFLEADALIVGSAFKEEGDWRRPVEGKRVAQVIDNLKN